MDVSQAIKQRTSVRKYQDKPVEENLIKELLEAARLAPSGNNAQPWRFIIITAPETKKKLKDNDIFPQEFVYTAPLILVCCSDPNSFKKHLPGLDSGNPIRAIRDLSIACQNLVLRAEELGLGTCYIGWMQKDKIKDVLDIPKHYEVPYCITIGYSAKEPKPSSRLTIKEIILKRI